MAVPVQAFGFARPQVRTDANRNATALAVGLKRIGVLRPKDVRETGASNFTIDGAPVDRDFVDFDKYCDYLPALGVSKIRILSGWAKSEREPGKIDVGWLDHIVDWCAAHGIETLLELSYGNPIYPGAGGAGLSDGIPNTEEGLAHWDRWVDYLAGHFQGRVKEWAMWNEPDIATGTGAKGSDHINTPEMIAAFNIRSAKIIRKYIPEARLHALSLARNKPEYLEECLKAMGDETKLFDTFVYHGYAINPDSSYPIVEESKKVLAKYAPHAVLRQGENGTASEYLDTFALCWQPWSELSQAKYDLRRALGDLGHDVESGLFCFVDINYAPPTYPRFFCNRKGYLRLNASNDVIQIKRAFYAIQNMVSIFNSRLTRVKVPQIKSTDRTLSLFEYRTREGLPVFTFWERGPVKVDFEKNKAFGVGLVNSEKLDARCRPSETLVTRESIFEWEGAPLKNPVWVDLITGWVYEIPAENQIVHSQGVTFVRIPSYDSPCVLAERAALDFSRWPSEL